jgi:hypothetical protein
MHGEELPPAFRGIFVEVLADYISAASEAEVSNDFIEMGSVPGVQAAGE